MLNMYVTTPDSNIGAKQAVESLRRVRDKVKRAD